MRRGGTWLIARAKGGAHAIQTARAGKGYKHGSFADPLGLA